MLFTNLFVYGTLLAPETREAVFGRPVPYIEPDTISGFEIEGLLIEDVSYPALIRSKSSMVHGGIVVIHEDELKLLDEYETDEYSRLYIRLMSGKQAWVYVKKSGPAQAAELTEEEVLYNVLCQISRGEHPAAAAPDDQYVSALSTIGIVKDGRDIKLTTFGTSIMNHLRYKLNSY